MPWISLPVSRTLLLTVKLWIAISLIASLLLGLVLKRRARNRNKVIESLIALSKNAPPNPRIQIVTRVK